MHTQCPILLAHVTKISRHQLYFTFQDLLHLPLYALHLKKKWNDLCVSPHVCVVYVCSEEKHIKNIDTCSITSQTHWGKIASHMSQSTSCLTLDRSSNTFKNDFVLAGINCQPQPPAQCLRDGKCSTLKPTLKKAAAVWHDMSCWTPEFTKQMRNIQMVKECDGQSQLEHSCSKPLAEAVSLQLASVDG